VNATASWRLADEYAALQMWDECGKMFSIAVTAQPEVTGDHAALVTTLAHNSLSH